MEDFEQCYRAVSSRDPRFDGRFVTAVATTGIYCRPSCPAQTPKPQNVSFYRVPAAAQAAGFRACKRCRPDSIPGSPEWDVRADLTARALRLIGEGTVDMDGVGGLARRLAVSERHLHRQLVAEVGAGPLALARTRRAQTARMLLESTRMPVTDIAFTAGYGSVRQFNDGFRAAFGMAPSEVRAGQPQRPAGAVEPAGGSAGAIVLRLRYRPPLDIDALWAWLGTRAVPGVEELTGRTYRRTLRLPRSTAIAQLTPGDGHLQLRLFTEDLRDLTAAVDRARRIADLDADPDAVAQTLSADPVLAPLVARRPGLRVPGSADGFELACRAVLGQQVTVAGARTLAGRLVAAFGSPLATPGATGTGGTEVPGSTVPTEAPAAATTQPAAPGVTWLFPTAADVAAATVEDLAGLGLPRSRAATLHGLAAAVADGTVTLDRGSDRADTARALLALPGVGPWTASYIAMRALGDPDALPASDLGLRRACERLGVPGDARALEDRATAWRPWRAYGAMHLWAHLADRTEPADTTTDTDTDS